MEQVLALIVAKFNYWAYVILMMIGFYAMIGKRNLVKKLIGMNIFQTAIILLFVSAGVKHGAKIPILNKYEVLEKGVDVAGIINPLPHVLMLTAIVVSVSITGVALAILLRIYREYGTLEEDEILEKLGK